MNFFDQHGVIALISLAVFPRLTLLFGAFVTGGFVWWVGWFFTPHLLVAILAIPYWDQNPFLVIVAWLVAFGGTGAETRTIQSRKK